MQLLRLTVGKASPCNLYHSRLDIACTVHGDDFTSCGLEAVIKGFTANLAGKYESKHRIFGPSSKHEKAIRVLNRVLSLSRDGMRHEADQRRADIVVSELGLKDAKPLTSPAVTPERGQNEPKALLPNTVPNMNRSSHGASI